MRNLSFLVKKHAIQQTKVIEQAAIDKAALKEGEVLVQIEQFALTANNITYAVTGNRIGYWHFYPVGNEWGIIPAWGFAKVIASKQAKIAEGSRIYGFLPMQQHTILTPGNFQDNGFSDVSSHRSKLPSVYNFYNLIDKDPSFRQASEAVEMIFRPLFTTSFLLNYYLHENDFFDAEQVIITSASSKTGFTLAFLLKQALEKVGKNIQITGLTSGKNKSFVEGLGFYEQVQTYNNLSGLTNKPACIVDFAGNHNLLDMLQKQLANLHKHTTLVGLSHWEEETEVRAEGSFFFAPDWIKKVNKEWGFAKFQASLAESWQSFTGLGEQKIQVKNIEGLDKLNHFYQDVLKGQVAANSAYVVKP